jgi:hypothetical protein
MLRCVVKHEPDANQKQIDRQARRTRAQEAMNMRKWLHRKPWLKMLGHTRWLYGMDMAGNQVWVCVRDGCHYIGDRCPSGKHGW